MDICFVNTTHVKFKYLWPSVKKQMVSCFFGKAGRFDTVYVLARRTVSADCYTNRCKTSSAHLKNAYVFYRACAG